MNLLSKSKILISVSLLTLTSCFQGIDNFNLSENNAINVNKDTSGVIALKEVFDSSVEKIPTLTAVGFAVVSSQPGRTQAQKRLMAIRSARMSAMRNSLNKFTAFKLTLILLLLT